MRGRADGEGAVADPVVDRERKPEGPSVVAAVILLYALILGAGYFWLWLRDRTESIPEEARGDYGLWVSMGIGTAVGLGI